MRKEIKEAFLREEKAQHLSERREYSERLFEKWSHVEDIGDKMNDLRSLNESKAMNLSIMLENEANHLKHLTETQISSSFSTTPENVLRIVRLGYPNSVRGEIFYEYPMVTARDSIYYLSPVYSATARGATDGDVTHESAAYRYASEIEEEEMVDGGSHTVYTLSATYFPIRPYTMTVLVDNEPVATDDGDGNITGTLLTDGSVTYSTGDISIEFDSALAGTETVKMVYSSDIESMNTDAGDIQSVELQLTDHQLRAQPYPLYVSWSKMAELLVGTTLDIDMESSLIQGAADELKKSLDFQAVRMGYRYSLQNSTASFDGDYAAAGADSEVAHAQGVTKTVKQMANVIYDATQRGGISSLVVGSDVAAYLTLHNKFTADGAQPEVGIYRIGSLMGKPVYQAPNSIIPTDDMLGVWRNPSADDYSLVFASLIPLYQTQVLEYKDAYKETGLYHFGDNVPIQTKYLVKCDFSNIS